MQHFQQESFADWLPVLAGATDEADLQMALERLRDVLGVRHMVFHWVNAPGGQTGAATYPQAWLARYVSEDYMRIDPVVSECRRSFTPLDWKSMDWSSARLRRFMGEALDYGVAPQGYFIPVHGPGGEFSVLTLNDDRGDADWSAFCTRESKSLIPTARAFHSAFRDLHAARTEAQRALSQREVEVLEQIARGHNRAEAARRLDISEHTLRDHLESARGKLGAQNTLHAVTQAMAQGHIAL